MNQMILRSGFRLFRGLCTWLLVEGIGIDGRLIRKLLSESLIGSLMM
jgi:hypothetical protein